MPTSANAFLVRRSWLSRSVFAGDSLPTEDRDAAKVIAALRKLPKAKAELARVRFYAEVLGGKTVKVAPL